MQLRLLIKHLSSRRCTSMYSGDSSWGQKEFCVDRQYIIIVCGQTSHNEVAEKVTNDT